MKMYKSLVFVTAILVSVLMAGCPSSNQKMFTMSNADKVDQLTKGNKGWRTWSVYKTDTPDKKHMVSGDAFRLKKSGNKYHLQPLTKLRKRWGHEQDPNFQVELKPVTGAKPLLCGTVKVPGHSVVEEVHYILIEWQTSDYIQITYEIEDDKVPDQCTSRSSHGGRAHAQN